MVMRHLFIICFVLLLTGCPRTSDTRAPIPTIPHSSQKTIKVPAFTRVNVDGVLNVSLHTGYSHPSVVLRGDPRDLAYVVTTVSNGTLNVILGDGYPQHGGVQVEVNSRYLNSFEYHGAGAVTGRRLRTSLLDLLLDNKGQTMLGGHIGLRKLIIKGDGYTEITGINSPYLTTVISSKATVRLGGVVNLTNLNINNGGRLSLYWVKSRDLIIRERGSSFVQLGGMVNKLDVELWDKARFNGRYLRAERAFVKTHGQSIAEMSAAQRQHTLASGSSDIHFYNIPTLKADFMAFEGAVLDMRDLGSPYVQEYTQYNK